MIRRSLSTILFFLDTIFVRVCLIKCFPSTIEIFNFLFLSFIWYQNHNTIVFEWSWIIGYLKRFQYSTTQINIYIIYIIIIVIYLSRNKYWYWFCKSYIKINNNFFLLCHIIFYHDNSYTSVNITVISILIKEIYYIIYESTIIINKEYTFTSKLLK